MTATSTIKAIYLENFAATDVHEGDTNSEKAGALVGVTVDHTQMELVSITVSDRNHDGVTSDDECNSADDKISYNLGSGKVTNETDSSLEANVKLTLADGSVRTVKVVAFQQTNGDLFISDLFNHGTLDNLAISNVEITQITGSNFNGWYTNQSTDNTTIAAPVSPLDGLVEGDNAANLIDAGYTGDPEGDRVDANDAVLPGQTGDQDVILAFDGNDTVLAGDAADSVYAGGGDDSVLGGAGNDTIYGDSDLAGSTVGGTVARESFEWDKLLESDGTTVDNGDHITSATQDTGSVTVTFQKTAGNTNDGSFATEPQSVAGIDDGPETITPTSGFSSDLSAVSHGTASYKMNFSDPVSNVDFRINDIDGAGLVTVRAYDAAGNEVPVTFSAGSKLTVAGNTVKTATAALNTYGAENDPNYSTLVEVAGPVARIEIVHAEGDFNSGIWMSDVYFDALSDTGLGGGAPGDDVLQGGNGDDLIYGEAGDDLIEGGAGDDVLDGGTGNDTIFGDNGADGAPTGANLIVNGSFENTAGMTTTGYGFVKTGSITGWTADNARQEIDVHNDGRGGLDAVDGKNWLDLEASPGNIGVSQTVPGLTDGQSYQLAFSAGENAAQAGNTFEVIWGGEVIATIDPSNGTWTDYSFTVVGGAGDGSDTLTFRAVGNGTDNFGASIDDVTLFALAPDGGNDEILGGDGDDSILGAAGDDTITGGAGADALSGNDGRDVFIGGTAGDVVDGGTGGDDVDVLDLRAAGPLRVIDQTVDADGDSTSGTVEFLDATGAVTGTMTFAEIEQILSPENIAPVAADDLATTAKDTAVTISVLGNDTDANADTITVTGATVPAAQGTVIVNANGTLTFTPAQDFNGDATITYTVTDGNGGNDSATVTVTVTPVNDAPDAVDDAAITDFGTAVTIPVLGNDTDVDGDTLTVTAASVPADQGTVVVNADNTLTFTPASGFDGDATISYTITDGNGGFDSAFVTVSVAAGVPDGFVDGTAGDDLIATNSPLFPGVIYTGDPQGDLVDSNDALLPGEAPNDDIIRAGDGNDTVDAGLGNDDVFGGTGDDLVYGGDGNDSLLGEDGGDELIGDAGDDTLDGGVGDDTLRGGLGDDLIFGRDGNESVRSNEGNDTILGGGGNDTLRGGEDDDTVDGGADDDLLYGGLGNDSVLGGDGNDDIFGNEGRDTILGGTGDDTITADDGPEVNDYVTFLGVPVDANPDDNRDLVRGGDGNDVITTGDDADTVYGDAGNDTIDTGLDDDSVYGGDGDDSIDANLGSDYVEGGAGNDTIIAGIDAFSDYTGDDPTLPSGFFRDPVTGLPVVTDPNRDDGRDTVLGGDGNDQIYTGDDADVIYGEAGNDTIFAGIDDDFVDGGDSDDSIIGGHGSDTILGGQGNDVINAGDSALLFG